MGMEMVMKETDIAVVLQVAEEAEEAMDTVGAKEEAVEITQVATGVTVTEGGKTTNNQAAEAAVSITISKTVITRRFLRQATARHLLHIAAVAAAV
jgi:hypothetical protein